MGIIRGIFLVLVSVTLFLSIFSMALFWTLSDSLTYNNVENQSIVLVKGLLDQNTNITNQIHTLYPVILNYCNKNNSNYIFSFEGTTYDLPCETVSKGESAIVDESVRSQIHTIYYTDYNCNFLDCFKQYQIPFFLISETADNFWTGNFNLLLIISIVLSGGVFFLVEKKSNMPIILGSLLIINALLFIKLDVLFGLFSSNKTIFQLLWLFVSQCYEVSIKILIAGIIVLLVGIVLKIFKIGFSIEKFFEKFKKSDKTLQKQVPQKTIQKQVVKNVVKQPIKKSK
jgi:hypothetical protein